MPELSNEQLLALYKIAIEEYRFQVRLNWDRTAYHLTLNSGLIAIAIGLLKVGSAPIVNLFVAGVFFIGLLASVIGIQNIGKGHRYYRRTVVQKTLLEDRLGLTKPVENYKGRLTLAISTTGGQDEQLQILHNTERWLKRPLRGSITWWIVCLLILFCFANVLGVFGSVWLYYHSHKSTMLSTSHAFSPAPRTDTPDFPFTAPERLLAPIYQTALESSDSLNIIEWASATKSRTRCCSFAKTSSAIT